jgi:hypothetical protein
MSKAEVKKSQGKRIYQEYITRLEELRREADDRAVCEYQEQSRQSNWMVVLA